MSTSAKMSSMTERVNSLVKDGYIETFQPSSGGMKALSDDSFYSVNDIEIINFYRFEGQSDPADNAVVYVVETQNGKKGLIIDAYGMSADPAISEFIVQVEAIQKKITPKE
jgi:hypothetical protein